MHTCVFVCTHNTAPHVSLDELHPCLTCPKLFVPITSCFCRHLDVKVTGSVCSFDGGLTGTRDNISLNDNLQPELWPTPATSQPYVQPPKGKCAIVRNWLLQPSIREPTGNGINTVISHRVLNTPCFLPCLTRVLSLPASTPLSFSLVQAAQMPWHFGNVKQILAC